MTLIGWIIRVLAILFLVRLVLRFFAGIARGASSPAPGQSRKPATREGGHLVRDPHCGTYVPIGRALRDGSGEAAAYFCSEACRQAWGARKTG
jgi:uncharacterized protein